MSDIHPVIKIDTDPTVDQIRAFANALNRADSGSFGQDVVALCDKADFWQASYEEESELHAEARADRDRLASLVEKLRPYLPHARHNIGCPARRRDDCTCGLADLLAEMENR